MGDSYADKHLRVKDPEIPVVMELFQCNILSAKHVEGAVVQHRLVATARRGRVWTVDTLPFVLVYVPFEQLVVDGGCHSVTALYGSGGGSGSGGRVGECGRQRW